MMQQTAVLSSVNQKLLNGFRKVQVRRLTTLGWLGSQLDLSSEWVWEWEQGAGQSRDKLIGMRHTCADGIYSDQVANKVRHDKAIVTC